ncbi:MAG: carbohydrate porin [Acidocella sp.]
MFNTFTPWLAVQPDIQYIISPGGGIQDPNDPNHKLRNELVAGIRAVTTF